MCLAHIYSFARHISGHNTLQKTCPQAVQSQMGLVESWAACDVEAFWGLGGGLTCMCGCSCTV